MSVLNEDVSSLMGGSGLDHCIELVDQGWRFICVGSDTEYLRTGITTSLERFHK